MEQSRQMHLEETKKHGSILFPFNIYPCTIPKDFPSVALHWHRNMEIIYIKKGTLTVQIALQNHAAAQGDICVVPPGTLHSLSSPDGQTAEYENIICDPDFLGAGAADACALQYLVPLTAGQLLGPMALHPGDEGYDAVQACLTQAEDLCGGRPAGFELGVKGAMLQLIFHLMRLQPHAPVAEPPGTARLKQALQYIQQQYAQRITVEQIADFLGCSPSHFMRWFRQMTGSSFVSYLNEHRLAAAAERLRSTEDKILTIAQESGFESLSNFNRLFRLRYGATPREYRAGK